MLRRSWRSAISVAVQRDRRRLGRNLEPWGEDLVDRGAAISWSPCRPDDFCRDELVYFHPSAAGKAAAQTAALVSLLSEAAQNAAGALAAYGRPIADPTLPFVFQLSLAALFDAAGARIGIRKVPTGRQNPSIEPTLADATMLSLHARFNGALVYTEFAWAHELLTTAAWVGQLLSGRAAFMPEPVAGCLCDILRPSVSAGGSREPHALVAHFAERAAGTHRLLRHAEMLLAGQRDLHFPVEPSHMPAPECDPVIWNPLLADRFRQQIAEEFIAR